ncbi:hypothetical protein CRE_03980 [Caenorhabditis remanei]|uniref:Uncharacterized protein n=1 Tax=Caenorhabditis remanei TaxID=31234 RepID=E3LY60_CAERE|nr:hypothetical protein CRE_03980 [Caenorhabditis remanei]
MEGEISKTPYNTIYAPLKNKNKEVVCCEHGKTCGKGKDENQYVNLCQSPPKEATVASKLVEKLNKLADKSEIISLKSIMEKEKSTKKGKNERKKKAVIDDSQSYVMLGPARYRVTVGGGARN